MLDGVAVEADDPPVGIVKAHEQLHQCGLAAAGVPHQGDGFSLADVEGDVLDRHLVSLIRERDRLEGDAAVGVGRGQDRPGRFDHLRQRVDDFEKPLAGSQGVLQHMVDRMQLIDRRVKKRQVAEKGDERTDGDLPAPHEPDAVEKDEHRAQRADEHHRWRVHRPQAHHLQGSVAVVAAFFLEALDLVQLTVERQGFANA